MSTPPVFASCSNDFINGREARQKVVAHISNVKLLILSIGAFLLSVRISAVKQLSFLCENDENDGHEAQMWVPDAMVKKWFDFGLCG